MIHVGLISKSAAALTFYLATSVMAPSSKAGPAFSICLLLCRVAHSLNQVQAHSKNQKDTGDLQPLVALGEDCTTQ